MNKFSVILLFLTTNIIACSQSDNFQADDIEIFKNTPVWNLAKAVSEHDISEMEELLKVHPDWSDYKEPKFQISLLFWSFYNTPSKRSLTDNFYEEARILIKHGANPYYMQNDNVTPIMLAASIHSSSAKFIQLCINSKFTQELSDSLKRFYLSEALIAACGKIREEVDGVHLLLEAGADINYYSKDSVSTPVSESITQENMQIAKYLIVKQNAKFDIIVKRMVDRADLSILKRLQDLDFSQEPLKEKTRLEILKFIRHSQE